MPATSPRLALPYLQPAQAQKHVTHNEALQLLDAVVQLRIQDFDLTLPPEGPLPGDVVAVGAGAQGDWAGQDGRLALWDGTGWQFIAPREGWLAWDATSRGLRVLTGAGWTPAAPALQNLPGLGVGTASDDSNRLAVASEATLLSHAGAGHQVKVNKAAPSDTASLLFQSDWTGHAEMGLAGDLDLAIKVSDGTSWTEALRVARATGVVTLPRGAAIDGPVTGAAVQAGPADATPGRLLTAGAFGLGGPLPPVGDASVAGALVPGLYAYDLAEGSAGGPEGVLRGVLLHARRGAAAGETQLLVTEAGASVPPGLVFGRARSGGGWSAWSCGSVTESASGPNGRVLRSQDGTQTCWHTLTTSAASETVWTFPQPFAASPVVTMGVGDPGLAPLFPRHAAKGAASVGLSVVDASGTRIAASLDLVAIGRWA